MHLVVDRLNNQGLELQFVDGKIGSRFCWISHGDKKQNWWSSGHREKKDFEWYKLNSHLRVYWPTSLNVNKWIAIYKIKLQTIAREIF